MLPPNVPQGTSGTPYRGSSLFHPCGISIKREAADKSCFMSQRKSGKAAQHQPQPSRRTTQPSSHNRPPSIFCPHPFVQRNAEDIHRSPSFGSGILLQERARRKPVEIVCSLFDYGMDTSLLTQWDEWEHLAVTSTVENEYNEGSNRGRLLRFGKYFRSLIAAWLRLYVPLTPDSLRLPMQLPAGMPPQKPAEVIHEFTRLYNRAESLKELWSLLDAVMANPATPQKTRMNLLSGYEIMACVTEASFALKNSPENPLR